MIWPIFAAALLLASPDHVITHEAEGRFGDQLLSYLHAKWISYQYHIPFRYRPFPYSSRLILDTKEQHLDTDPNKDKRIALRLAEGSIDLQREDSVMYVCPYFPENQWERQRSFPYHFDVDWKNQEFRNLIREMVTPKKALKLIVPPKYTVNIAIHVREGGGYDDARAKVLFPLKLPPMTFYTEALQKILPLFPNQKIHCQILTDATDPEKIEKLFKSALPPHSSVQFAYRKKNSRGAHVLNDFFSLFNFDILIRPQSSFSVVPSLIHDYAIVYSPIDASVEGDQVVITQTEMAINAPLYQQVLLKKKPWWKIFSW